MLEHKNIINILTKVTGVEVENSHENLFSIKYNISPIEMAYFIKALEDVYFFKINELFIETIRNCTSIDNIFIAVQEAIDSTTECIESNNV